ncbi:S8/S53 family peptidase [Sphaerisporangium sp. NPDC049002]|uniref:S8/S53 family peptidase n=1 Tax=Sphaerisporangium sp. NPDC049002 TaxID=3155392 RepID=UPI0033ED70C0
MAFDRFMEQLGQISRAMGVPLAAGPEEDPRFLYEYGHILVPAAELSEVVPVVNAGRRVPVTPPHEREARAGLLRIPVTDPDDSGSRDGGVTRALAAIKLAEARNGGRKMGSRNHIIAITTGGVNSCPSDEPAFTERDWHPGIAPPSAAPARPVSIVVIDTGLLVDHDLLYPWMRHVVPTPGEPLKRGGLPAGVRPSDPVADPDPVVKEYVGHGTFIAGIISAIAPRAAVRVSGKLVHAGAISEQVFGEEVLDAVGSRWPGLADLAPGLDDGSRWPDIISLSAGTSNEDGEPLLGLQKFMSRLADHPETLLVAAAGNNGSDAPFWPAAYTRLPEYREAVLSVGALREDGRHGACFTDHGDWVQVYAPGERLVGAFLGTPERPRRYRYQHSTYGYCRWRQTSEHDFDYDCTCGFPARAGELSTSLAEAATQDFTGRAEWSGTSFATPAVAAMIANCMMENPGLGSRAAAVKLLTGPALRTAEVRGRSVPALWPPLWNPREVVLHPPRP